VLRDAGAIQKQSTGKPCQKAKTNKEKVASRRIFVELPFVKQGKALPRARWPGLPTSSFSARQISNYCIDLIHQPKNPM
jgi:hypothetical protein